MRRRALFAGAVVVATAAAWIATARLPLAARAFCTLLLVPLPVFMGWQARAAGPEAEDLPRIGLYASSALLLAFLVALTAVTALAAHLAADELGLMLPSAATLAAWSAGTYAAGAAVLVLGRLGGATETPLLRHLIPVSPREKLAFAALALLAGLAEELVFRGFLLWALARAAGSIALAIVLSSAVFGIMHAYQDIRGAARAGILGAILAASVVATSSIVPAMIAHAALDLTSGLVLARWLLGTRP